MKTKTINILIILLTFIGSTKAQDPFQPVLQQIESRNTTLQALREMTQAEKIGNKTGIYLANPEVEFGYLWGSPKEIGNRTDLNVTQTFDFPTAYHYKSKVAEGKNQQSDLWYNQQRLEILKQARTLCVELVYQTIRKKELEKRLQHAHNIHTSYQILFDKGNADILELNKTKFNLLNAEQDLKAVAIETEALLSELQRLNGGYPLPEISGSYPVYAHPADFNEWFEPVKQKNPALQQAEQEIEISNQQENLRRALNLPKLSAGYTSERIAGTTLQGITVGVSIPLFENKNTVKYQQAYTHALQIQYEDAVLRFRNLLKTQYDKSSNLQTLLKEYRKLWENTQNNELLRKALDKGQLSLINYFTELAVYYETTDKFQLTEKEYQLSIIALQIWEN